MAISLSMVAGAYLHHAVDRLFFPVCFSAGLARDSDIEVLQLVDDFRIPCCQAVEQVHACCLINMAHRKVPGGSDPLPHN